MKIRKCVRCQRIFDALEGCQDIFCPLCSGDVTNCEEITEFAVYLKDDRSSCDEQEPKTVIRRDLPAPTKKQQRAMHELALDFEDKILPTKSLETAAQQLSNAMGFDVGPLDEIDLILFPPQEKNKVIPLSNQEKSKTLTPKRQKRAPQKQCIQISPVMSNPYVDSIEDDAFLLKEKQGDD